MGSQSDSTSIYPDFLSGPIAFVRFLDRFQARYLTTTTLVGLVLGVGLGMLAYGDPLSPLSIITPTLDPLLSAWVSAIKVVVIPLVIAYFVVAVISIPSGRETGRLGLATILTHTIIALTGLVFALVVAKFTLPAFEISIESLRPQLAQIVAPDGSNGSGATLSLWEGVKGQVWVNPVTALRRAQVLPILIWTLLFSVLLRRMRPSIRDSLNGVFRAVIAVGRYVVGGLLLLMPLVVFGYSFEYVALLGIEIVGAIGFYIALTCVVAIVIIGLLYVSMPVWSDVSTRRFASAVLPAQLMAIGSRSSMACLPALMEAAEKDLGLSDVGARFVLPLSVSSFKLSRAVTTPVKFFFLAHLFSVNLDPGAVAVFIAAEFLLSYGTPGLPSASTMLMMPVYLAAGIPIEGYLLLKAVDTIPDIANTVLNVTEDLALAGIVDGMAMRRAPSVAPAVVVVE